MVDHLRLGTEAHGRISALVTRLLPGLPDLEHRRIVQEIARDIVPLIVAAHEREAAILRRRLELQDLADLRREDSVLILRNALRWFEHVEGEGWRATRALIETRWTPPRDRPR